MDMGKQMSLTPARQIDELPSSELETFRKEFLNRNKPVVLKGLARDWPAFSSWSLEYFKKACGDAPVGVRTPPPKMYSENPDEHLEAIETHATQRLTLGGYMDILATDESTKTYLEAFPIREKLPELWKDVRLPSYIQEKQLFTSTLWVGPKGTTTSLHYDVPHNTLVQVMGRKQITLFAPGEISNLYPISWLSVDFPLSSSVNISSPDLNRFPRFARATPYKTILHPGDGLFLPGCWWHEVHNMDITAAVNFWWRPPLKAWADPDFFYTGMRGVATFLLKGYRAKKKKKVEAQRAAKAENRGRA